MFEPILSNTLYLLEELSSRESKNIEEIISSSVLNKIVAIIEATNNHLTEIS